jgi:hypothetical protein
VDDSLEQWLCRTEAQLLAWSYSRQVTVDYAEIGDGVAQYRMRVILLNGSQLQCVERARLHPDGLRIEKYSFHWQSPDENLIYRWDNAPHHPELSTFPHHIHESDDVRVLPHEAIDVAGVLEKIEKVLPESFQDEFRK